MYITDNSMDLEFPEMTWLLNYIGIYWANLMGFSFDNVQFPEDIKEVKALTQK